MSWTSGRGTYDYNITVGLKEIGEAIVEELVERGLVAKDRKGEPLADWEVDDEQLLITATGECHYRHWSCPATLYDPPEDELELSDTIDEEDVEAIIMAAFTRILHLDLGGETNEESFEPTIDEPDPDMMPGGHDWLVDQRYLED